MITDVTGLPVRGYSRGTLGGNQQIGAKIVEGKIDFDKIIRQRSAEMKED